MTETERDLHATIEVLREKIKRMDLEFRQLKAAYDEVTLTLAWCQREQQRPPESLL